MLKSTWQCSPSTNLALFHHLLLSDGRGYTVPDFIDSDVSAAIEYFNTHAFGGGLVYGGIVVPLSASPSPFER